MKESNRENGKIFFLFLGVIISVTLLLFTTSRAANTMPDLRVGIFLNQNDVNITGDGSYELVNLKSGKLICTEKGKILKMSAHAKGIEISGKGIFSGPIKVAPIGKAKVTVIVNGEKYRYRGNIEISYDAHSKKLNIINIIDIEEYLYGVLKKEISPKWPEETLKAQAIAARTFAIFNINKYIEKGYNLDASTNSQAYGGLNDEELLTNKAVDATRGKIMVYNKEPINAVYHSDSGGYTANSEDVWGSILPYLRGVKSTFEELVSPTHHHWEYTISEKELIQKLSKIGYDLDSITDIKLNKKEKSGRVSQLGFISSDNKIKYITAKEFRSLIGFEVIRSTIFSFESFGEKSIQKIESVTKNIDENPEQSPSVIVLLEEKKDWTIKELLELMKQNKKVVEKKEDEKEIVYSEKARIFKFSGSGNGHGVGMSQWGAYGMALEGYNYKDILSYYYQGIDIIKKY